MNGGTKQWGWHEWKCGRPWVLGLQADEQVRMILKMKEKQVSTQEKQKKQDYTKIQVSLKRGDH